MSDIATDGISLIWPKRPGKEIFPFMPVAAEHVEIHVSLYAIDLSVMVILPNVHSAFIGVSEKEHIQRGVFGKLCADSRNIRPDWYRT